jgi:membrane protease YdiL (CAAX protease family)
MSTPDLQASTEPGPSSGHGATSNAPAGRRVNDLWIWLVIAALVAAVVYRNTHARPTASDENLIRNMTGELRAKSLIGLKGLRLGAGPASEAGRADVTDRLIRSLETDARTPDDQLVVAIIAAEIQSKEQGLQRLDALSKTPTSPELDADISALRTIYTKSADALDPAAQDRLIQRHGYLGRVALAIDAPPKSEQRKSIEQSGKEAVLLIGVFGVALILFLIVSCCFSVAAVLLMAKGKIRKSYAPDSSDAPNSAFLEVFALYLVLFLVGFGLARRQLGLVDVNWEWLAWSIIPVTMLWAARRGATPVQQRMAFGWYAGRGWLWELGAGIGGYLAGVPIIAVGFLMTLGLTRLTHTVPAHPLVHMLKGNLWHVLGLYALTCIFAPVIEETMFRGALFHHLRRRWSWLISAPVVAFIFAVIHPQGWVTVPVLGSIAIVLAALREWRGSIIAPMAAHALNNFLALTLALVLLR